MESSQIYDDYWKSGKHPDPHWTEVRISKEFKHLAKCEKILDYGCGPIARKYGDTLAKICSKYIGADISEYIVEKNRKDGFDCLQIDSSGGVELENESVDGAVCCEVFEHLYNPLEAAMEIYRVLEPGGHFVAMVPHFGYHAWRLQALLRAQVPHEPEDPRINRHNGVHIRYFSMLTFQRLLQDAGFSDVQISGYDFSSIWDITRGLGHLAHISDWARKNMPHPFHFTWLQSIYPNVFAMRLKAECIK